ncbi:uncharacterized protein BCR38DRAFT_523064 [Pseudomassariella vexata]|uniref:PinX1-related protein 1 n=1 Tax=Pseudomassariella vexata TaxID=1141098 RepID=A0A1Y2E3V7_9PEZI|nr:uncharacterized protein BCR38DRAFT_523064 [Pseudomassariella vexata]ORY66243.1 hypothetical protein BCR38DRAFT_523064 [Pseudomassariella vexata]
MGLAGQKIRRKLQQDPNNTKWTRDTTTFGQKILRAHGWEPGQYLGVQNASHADHHTAASAAPIKILLKDDNLGLGAKVLQKQNAECTGLDGFKDLLGRLNGKSDETIQKERQVRSEFKTNLYMNRKFGPMRFVPGGLLVGDKLTDLMKKNPADKVPESISADTAAPATGDDTTAEPKKEKKSKKRRAEEADGFDASDEKREKKKKKRSKGNPDSEGTTSESASDGLKKTKKSKDKKHKKSEANDEAMVEPGSKSKKSTKAKRESPEDYGKVDLEGEEKRAKKDKKKQKKKHVDLEKTAETESSITQLVVTTPQASGASTPQPMSARHYARSRNIASKRLAMADMAALNQIFMVKPV